MASDLSTLIQEGLCNTINGLIAKKTEITQTSRATANDIINLNLLRVDSSFEFDKITTNWSFFIPAYSASYIFNTMLGDSSEPSLELDEDIADAMKEFFSNYSGSLTTAINGENLEDLGQSKFVVGDIEILTSDQINDLKNMFKFSLDLEEKSLEIFIKFDENILPFLEQFTSIAESEPIEENKEEESKEEPQIQSNEEKNEEKKEEETSTQENKTNPEEKKSESKNGTDELKNEPEKSNEKENKENIKNKDEEEEEKSQKKPNKLKLIVIIIAGLLILTIIAGVIMYFMGMFDPQVQEPVKEPAKQTLTTKTNNGPEITKYKEKRSINFKITQINKDRLNVRLEALTKYEVLSQEQLQAQEAEQKERLYQLQKEQELIEFAAKNTEEDIFTRKEDDPKHEVEIKTKFSKSNLDEDNSTNIENKDNDLIAKTDDINDTKENNLSSGQQSQTTTALKTNKDELKFITVETLKYKLYNQLISKVTTQTARVSICKNKQGRTTVYIGPFYSKDDQNMMMELISQENIKGSQAITISTKEFDTRCSFE